MSKSRALVVAAAALLAIVQVIRAAFVSAYLNKDAV